MKKVCKICLSFLMIVLISFSFSACDFTGKEINKLSKKLSTYSIDAVFADDAKSVSATMDLSYINNTDSVLDHLDFNLFGTAFSEDAQIKPCSELNHSKCFPNGESFGDLQILQVYVNGKNVNFIIEGKDNNLLCVPLLEELYPDGVVTVKINFLLLLANCTHRLGYYGFNINLGNWFPVVCVYEQGKFVECAYYPNGDPFYSDVANFDVKITYPALYSLVATGNEVDHESTENYKTCRFKALCVRDFAMVLSSNFAKVSQMVDGVEINYYGYNNDSDLQDNLNVSVLAYQTFCELFGKYPYSVLNVVKTPFVHGGMEYPNLVYISDSITDPEYYKTVIVHEIAHQWWYGVVGNNEITHAWIDEGLAEYSTILFYMKNPNLGKNADEMIKANQENYCLYADVVGSIGATLNEKMTLSSYEYSNEYEYVYMIYVKGVLMFDNLAQTIGQDKVILGLQKLFKDNKFKLVKAEEVINSFELASKRDLTGFFESWLDGKVDIVKTQIEP